KNGTNCRPNTQRPVPYPRREGGGSEGQQECLQARPLFGRSSREPAQGWGVVAGGAGAGEAGGGRGAVMRGGAEGNGQSERSARQSIYRQIEPLALFEGSKSRRHYPRF